MGGDVFMFGLWIRVHGLYGWGRMKRASLILKAKKQSIFRDGLRLKHPTRYNPIIDIQKIYRAYFVRA
jgi:hypothetical protein